MLSEGCLSGRPGRVWLEEWTRACKDCKPQLGVGSGTACVACAAPLDPRCHGNHTSALLSRHPGTQPRMLRCAVQPRRALGAAPAGPPAGLSGRVGHAGPGLCGQGGAKRGERGATAQLCGGRAAGGQGAARCAVLCFDGLFACICCLLYGPPVASCLVCSLALERALVVMESKLGAPDAC